MSIKPNPGIFYLLAAVSLLFTSCGHYSFSGGDTGCAQTITIKNFYNDAGNGAPTIAQAFTERLRDYYQQNTKLSLVNNNGDWMLDGRIIGYSVAPVAPSGDGTSDLNRLTIKVSVSFINRQYQKQGKEETCLPEPFEQEFSWYADFPKTQTLSQVEGALVETILSKLVFDIFSRTTSNW